MGVAADKAKRALSAGPMKSNGQSEEAPVCTPEQINFRTDFEKH